MGGSGGWPVKELAPAKWCEQTWTTAYGDPHDGDNAKLVDRWEIQGRDSTLEKWETFAKVYRTQVEDARKLLDKILQEGQGGGRKYTRVTAWIKGAKNQVSTKTFGMLSDEDEDLGRGTERGVVAQTQGHTERVLNMLLKRLEKDEGRYIDRETRAYEMEKALFEERLKLVELRQTMEDRSAEREVKKMGMQTITKGFDALMGAIRAYALGLPSSESEKGKVLVDSLVDLAMSLNEDQIAKITAAGILQPHQQVALLTLMQTAVQQKEEEESEGPAGIPPALVKQLRNLPPDERKQALALLGKSKALAAAKPEEKGEEKGAAQ